MPLKNKYLYAIYSKHHPYYKSMKDSNTNQQRMCAPSFIAPVTWEVLTAKAIRDNFGL